MHIYFLALISCILRDVLSLNQHQHSHPQFHMPTSLFLGRKFIISCGKAKAKHTATVECCICSNAQGCLRIVCKIYSIAACCAGCQVHHDADIKESTHMITWYQACNKQIKTYQTVRWNQTDKLECVCVKRTKIFSI